MSCSVTGVVIFKTPNIHCFVAKTHLSQFTHFLGVICSAIDSVSKGKEREREECSTSALLCLRLPMSGSGVTLPGEIRC